MFIIAIVSLVAALRWIVSKVEKGVKVGWGNLNTKHDEVVNVLISEMHVVCRMISNFVASVGNFANQIR